LLAGNNLTLENLGRCTAVGLFLFAEPFEAGYGSDPWVAVDKGCAVVD
jgi:hypothetical protein